MGYVEYMVFGEAVRLSFTSQRENMCLEIGADAASLGDHLINNGADQRKEATSLGFK